MYGRRGHHYGGACVRRLGRKQVSAVKQHGGGGFLRFYRCFHSCAVSVGFRRTKRIYGGHGIVLHPFGFRPTHRRRVPCDGVRPCLGDAKARKASHFCAAAFSLGMYVPHNAVYPLRGSGKFLLKRLQYMYCGACTFIHVFTDKVPYRSGKRGKPEAHLHFRHAGSFSRPYKRHLSLHTVLFR